MAKFVNLDTKTSYSFFNSLISVDKLIEKAVKENIKTLAIADVCNLYGAIDFYFACIKNGIKPIIGIELAGNEYCVLLVAKNRLGFDELTKLSFMQLENSNLNKTNDVLSQIRLVKNCFIIDKSSKPLSIDSNDYFIGRRPLQPLDTKHKVVALPTARMFSQDQERALQVFDLAGRGQKINDKDVVLNSYSLDYFYSDSDFENDFEKEELDNLEMIVNSIDLKIDIATNNLINFLDKESADKKLIEECKTRFPIVIPTATLAYKLRLESEIEIINKLGFSNYFLVVMDYVAFARKSNISVGTGRGSVGGSLVAYVLGITTVDPIKADLLFERFLNPDRVSMPDIDIDFQDDRRDEVVSYILNKYGVEHVAHIITYQTLKAKMSIRDIGRVLDIDAKEVDSIAKLIPDDFTLMQIYEESSTFRNTINSSTAKKELFEIAKHVEGHPRQPGLHAAGVVLASDAISKHIPVENIGTINRTQVSMDFLEKLGLYKMDILGLRTLTVINNVLETIKAETGTSIDLDKIDFEDKKVYETIAKANTLGVFQLETPGARKALRQIKPSNFEDIVATTSLNRPGPQEFIRNYVARKEGRETIEYYDPILENVLRNTYGIIVYQEQIMQISQVFANLSFAKADLLRRAISKKDASQIEKLKTEFFNGARELKHDDATISRVYSAIERFADYGFNRSHAYAYSVISYQMAFLKTYHYKQFYQDLLSTSLSNKAKILEYFNELEHFGISPAYPSINKHFYDFEITNTNVHVPIIVVNGIGNIAVQELRDEVTTNGDFKDFFDFILRIANRKVNKKVVGLLIDSGALDVLGNLSRKAMHENIEIINKYVEVAFNKKTGEFLKSVPRPDLIEVEEDKTVSDKEIVALGFMIKQNKAQIDVKAVAASKGVSITNIVDLEIDKEVIIYGKLTSIRAITTKNGAQMAFATLQDQTGNINLTIFPNFYKHHIDDLKKDNLLIIKGKLEIKQSKTFICSQIKSAT